MILDRSVEELTRYTARQLENFFPDGRARALHDFQRQVEAALLRVEYCFSRIARPGYTAGGNATFDIFHADQYCTYLYYLSNTIYRNEWDLTVAKQLYALNKTLNGINCLYDTELPDVYCVVHGVGTILGRAKYENYLVVLHNVTVGAISGTFPTMNEKLILSAGSSILGDCTIGENVLLEPHAHVIKTNVPANTRVAGTEPPYRMRPNTQRPIEYYFRPETSSTP